MSTEIRIEQERSSGMIHSPACMGDGELERHGAGGGDRNT